MNTIKPILAKSLKFLCIGGLGIVGMPLALFGIVFSAIAIVIAICAIMSFGAMILSVCLMQSCYEFLKKKCRACLIGMQIIKTEIALLLIYTAFCIRNSTEPWV